MKNSDLPKTDSVKALAAFWDNHDVTDLENELEEVTEAVFDRQSSTVIEIHLQLQEAETIENIAQLKGITQEALVHEWIQEKLHQSVN